MKQLETVFKAFSDKNRLRIIKLLEKKKMCVCEIAFVLGIKQPSVSRHISKLKSAGIIEYEQDGLWTNYFISPNNNYASIILALLKTWVNDSDIIKKDTKKLSLADRNIICNR